MNIEDLLKRIAVGNESALEELHRIMHGRIVAFALQWVGNPVLAEEVSLETLFEVWQHASRFSGESKASTWILGIARHKALDKLRQTNRGQAWLDSWSDEYLEIASDDEPLIERGERSQRATALHDCMKGLSLAQRECLHLVFFQEMSLDEVAALQACPTNTIKTRLFHARRKLRACLEACGHGGFA